MTFGEAYRTTLLRWTLPFWAIFLLLVPLLYEIRPSPN